MLVINGDKISLSVGDTCTLLIKAQGDLTLSATDRVMFTIKDNFGGILFQKVVAAVNNVATITFANNETDTITPGTYKYDVRYIINPYYDTDGTTIINGDRVITPKERQDFTFLAVVGDV